MASSVSNYPTSLDTTTEFPDPTGVQLDGDGNANRVHSTLHNSLAGAVIQLQTALGITGAFNASKPAAIIAGANAPAVVKALADATCDGTNDDVEVQAAHDALSSGRTWDETIVLVGDFTFGNSVFLDSFTVLDLRQAYITSANSVNVALIRNSGPGQEAAREHITILGGVLDGNKANNTDSANRGIRLVKTSHFRIEGTRVQNCTGNGIRIEGKYPAEQGDDYRARNGILDAEVTTCGGSGVSGIEVVRSMRDVRFNVHAHDNLGNGVELDASEMSTGIINANSNDEHGIILTNFHSATLPSLRAMRNGWNGIHVKSLQYSAISDWVAGGNSQAIADGADLNTGLRWTASGSGTNEYYCELTAGGDPSLNAPSGIQDDGTALVRGTLGSLAAGEWGYGDNDSLGFNAIYARLSDGTDPDASTMTAEGHGDVVFAAATGSYGQTKNVAGSNIVAGNYGLLDDDNDGGTVTAQARYALWFVDAAEGDRWNDTGSLTTPNGRITLTNVELTSGTTGTIKYPGTDGQGEISVQRTPITKVKQADQTVNDSVTLTNITELTFPVEANTTYKLVGALLGNSGTTPDFKFQASVPAGGAADIQMQQASGGGNFDEAGSTNLNGQGADSVIMLNGIVIIGATAGTFAIQYAQNTQDASNTDIKAGSYITLEPIF